MYCSKCGSKLGDNSKFCKECGTPVGITAPVAAPVTPAPAPAVQQTAPAAPAKESGASKGLRIACFITGIIDSALMMLFLAPIFIILGLMVFIAPFGMMIGAYYEEAYFGAFLGAGATLILMTAVVLGFITNILANSPKTTFKKVNCFRIASCIFMGATSLLFIPVALVTEYTYETGILYLGIVAAALGGIAYVALSIANIIANRKAVQA